MLLVLSSLHCFEHQGAAQTPPKSQASVAEIEAFWQKTLKRVSGEPLGVEAEPVKEALPYNKYRVTYRSLHGVKVRAYVGTPIQGETTPKPLPAIITAPGYGGKEQGVMLDECQRGYVVLQVFPRSQGESADLWKIDGPDRLTWRINQPEGYYYQGAYVDVIRAIDYLQSRPDVDKSRIGLMGTSQGGGIVLAVGGLDPRVQAVVAHVPFLCDMRRAAKIEGSLIKKLLEDHHALSSENLRTLDYFDPVNLVHRLKAPALLSAGGQDPGCPAETIRTVFERLAGIKSLVYYPELPHTSAGDFYRMSWEWMGGHLAMR
jgi:cephalosporin-C deacetylase